MISSIRSVISSTFSRVRVRAQIPLSSRSRFASGGYVGQGPRRKEDGLGKLAPDVLGQLIAQKVILGTDRSGLRLPLGIEGAIGSSAS